MYYVKYKIYNIKPKQQTRPTTMLSVLMLEHFKHVYCPSTIVST